MENIVANFWNRNKIIFKSFWIGILSLLLLIPTAFIQNLVSERQQRQEDAVTAISSGWGGAQTVTGPIIGIPYLGPVTGSNNTTTEKRWAYFLPAQLEIRSRIVPEKRYRGIYQAIVYTTELQFKNPLGATLPGWLPQAAAGPLTFSTTIRLKGTGNLSFIPTGGETKVEASSSWPDPGFNGTYLPDLRTVKDSGFVADWRVLWVNRKFPQQWRESTYDLNTAAFGVSLIVPVDTYQQTTRSVKYAILIILLTFTAFFLIEWIYQHPLHSLQYLLVGFALCLFYTLLLSFSEYIGFNKAYGVAAIATIGLITWYVASTLRSTGMSLFIAMLLAVQYGFVFILIQLQDYALLVGSIGLFIALAAVMYFSRKIKQIQ